MSNFFKEVTLLSEGLQLGLNVKNVEGIPELNELVKVYVFARMLEAKDINKLDIMYPFNGALLNLICCEDRTCPDTTMLIEYVDTMQLFYGYKRWKICT